MNTTDKSKFPLVLIIGGGFGGLQVAKHLKDKPVEVLMLDKHNYHTFQPLLYQVAIGSLEAEAFLGRPYNVTAYRSWLDSSA